MGFWTRFLESHFLKRVSVVVTRLYIRITLTSSIFFTRTARILVLRSHCDETDAGGSQISAPFDILSRQSLVMSTSLLSYVHDGQSASVHYHQTDSTCDCANFTVYVSVVRNTQAYP
jgi:hypothetical protein